MTDLFKEKAQDWDARPVPAMISEGVGAALLQQLDLQPTMRVMDFGAGTGLICAHVAPLVQTIFAVDISAAMLERLAAKPELQGKVEVVCQDILDQPLEVRVDLIMSAMALHHIEDTNRLLEVFFNHLEPGGIVALADLDTEDGSFHPPGIEGVFHHGIDRDELRRLLQKNGFADINFVTAVEVNKEDRSYPIFLVTAKKVSTSA